MHIAWSADGEGDDEELLAAESVDERFFIVVVDFDDLGSWYGRTAAAFACQSCDGVTACGEEGVCESLADAAAGLKTK